MPTQTPLTLAAVFKMMALLIGDLQKTRRKVDQFGAMTFLEGRGDQQKTRKRVDKPKNFGPLQKEILPPLEQHSSCGTDYLFEPLR